MVSSTLPVGPVKIALPTREEWSAMLASPSVIITIVICATLVALATLAGVVWLAYTGNDAAVVGTVIGAVMVGIGAVMNARIRRVADAVKDQQSKE